MLNNKLKSWAIVWITALFLVGCGETPVPMKSLAPSASSQKAIETYDTNGDGHLDAAECSPAMAVLLETGDTDKDGKLNLAEIKERLQFHDDRRVGLISTSLYLKSARSNLNGIKIRLVPDPIFTGIPAATGVSDENGHVVFQSQGESIPGVCPGLYSIVLGENDDKRTLKRGIEIGQTASRGAPEIDIDEQ